MRMHKKTVVMTACLTLILLVGCKKEIQAPAVYQLGEDSVPSLNEAVGASSSQLKYIESIDEGEDTTGTIYTYTLPGSGGQVVENYVASLTAEQYGFRIIDSDKKPTQAPDFKAEEGSVSLAMPSEQEGMLMQMEISWTGEGCVVEVRQVSGEIKTDVSPMTAREAVEYLQSLSPQLLGLSGQSMKDYKIYFVEGEIKVDHIPCVRMQVYRTNSGEGGNAIAGTYLLSGDQQHLYRLSWDSGEVVEIKLP